MISGQLRAGARAGRHCGGTPSSRASEIPARRVAVLDTLSLWYSLWVMDLYLTNHALFRMLSRDISEEEIAAVLAAPQWMPETTRGTRYDAIVGRRRVGVVVEEGTDPLRVVTVFEVR